MLNIDELKFDEKGLIPAIVVDAENGKPEDLHGKGADLLLEPQPAGTVAER